MTRINCVPVETLSDKHLLAEYKEITRPFKKVVNRIRKHGVDHALDDCKIGDVYILNSGHEKFFFNKLQWLYYRYRSIASELVCRGFNIDEDKFESICVDITEKLQYSKYWRGWHPTPEDMYLNMTRLVKRSSEPRVIEELYSEN
jgi:deoxyribonuclease (pyrimidine dimer)